MATLYSMSMIKNGTATIKYSETILRPQFNTAQVDSFIDDGNPIRVSSSAPKPWTMRRENMSPCYNTMRRSDVPLAHAS